MQRNTHIGIMNWCITVSNTSLNGGLITCALVIRCNHLYKQAYEFFLLNVNRTYVTLCYPKRWYIPWLVVFNVPSTARSFRDGAPIYCPLLRTWSSVLTPSPPGIEPRVVAWQSIKEPLRQLHIYIINRKKQTTSSCYVNQATEHHI